MNIRSLVLCACVATGGIAFAGNIDQTSFQIAQAAGAPAAPVSQTAAASDPAAEENFKKGKALFFQTDDEKQAEGVKLLLKAGEAGYVEAYSFLGEAYFEEKGVPKDLEAAEKWLLKGKEKGNIRSMDYLANLYEFQKKSPESLKEAGQLYLKCAEAGHRFSMAAAAIRYYEGKDGYAQDFKEAAKWAQKAAELDIDESKKILGLMLAEGKGVEKDLVKASMWLTLAGDDGKAELEKLTPSLKPEQIAEAKKLAEEMTGKITENQKEYQAKHPEFLSWFEAKDTEPSEVSSEVSSEESSEGSEKEE